MRSSYLSISKSQQTVFEQLSRSTSLADGYRWLSPDEVPSAIPASLREKLVSALLMWSTSSVGKVPLVFNCVRIDTNANSLDQEPFGIMVSTSGASTAGVFIHHGDWDGRTVPITSEIRHILNSTAIANYLPLADVPVARSGPLSELERTPHQGAFTQTIQALTSSST